MLFFSSSVTEGNPANIAGTCRLAIVLKDWSE